MSLLITGGTGFLGAYLARYALNVGGEEHVYILDRYPVAGRVADILNRITILDADIADTGAVDSIIVRNGIDRVAHFAFILGSPSPGQMVEYAKVQLLGTANVLEAARNNGVRRVLFASSVAAYGKQQGDVLTPVRECYRGVLIANMGYSVDEAEKAIASGQIDGVAFGTAFLANPDLPARIKAGAPLNPPNPTTFYTPGPVGYTDYPFWKGV